MTGISSDIFAPEAITAETARFNAAMAERFKGLPGLWDIGLEKARSGGLMPKSPPSPRAYEKILPGGVGLHVVPAAEPKGVLMHIHGGGFILGSAAGQDWMLDRIADHAGLTCVSVEYRLAPEHPYPAAWDDCEAAAVWLLENAAEAFGSDRLLIAGESAGALLAVATLVRLRNKRGSTGFQGAALSFGVYDTSMTPSQSQDIGLVLKRADIARIAQTYAPDPSSHRDPEISPLYANLGGMPPALFTVGTLDAMLDDSMFMYCRWLAAGNQAELALYPGADHAFVGTPHPLAPEANARIDQFLSDLQGAG